MQPIASRCLDVTFVFGVMVAFSTGQIPAAQGPDQAAAEVDRLLASEILDAKTSSRPAPPTDDETFLRRVTLDLIGQPPAVEEVIAFALDPDSGKRAKVVEKLLADSRFGGNWSRYWRDVIFYRRSEDRALFAANVTTSYLEEQLNKNVPWDEIASSFITATGDVLEDGRTGLIMAQAGQPEETAAEISRIFMGIQIQCAQCHDHPTDRWTREQFHELAAFFPRVAVRPNQLADKRTFVVAVNDNPYAFGFGNNNNRFRGTPEHYMSDLDKPAARGTLMQPVFFVNGRSLGLGTRDAVRRGHLADWVTSCENEWFAKAYVNRVWSELVGEGFYEPVDDIGPDRTCLAPKTLDYLASQFVVCGHDTKWLFQTITSTEAYQRDSRSRRNYRETPFLANCSQRLRGDQLFAALTSVLGVTGRGGGRARGPYGAIGGPQMQFNLVFGYDPSERRDEISGSIPQSLLLMNSPLINQAISSRRAAGLGRLLAEVDDDELLTVQLYLRTLARRPTDGELKTCLGYVKEVGQRGEAFEDILWSLVNSTEFLHRR